MKKRFRLLACLLAVVGACRAVGANAPWPNIVVILADDLGYGDVQHLNPARGRIPTPTIDRLAQEGLVFTDAHSGSSVCTPTRYGLLTGRYAWRTRLQRGVIDGFAPPLIDADRLTLPAMVRGRGYHSAVIGKWHLGFTLDKGEGATGQEPGARGAPLGARTADGPVSRGFDFFYGVQHARSMGTFFEQDTAVEHVQPVDALGKLTHRATAYIRERARTGEPFFLYFAQTSPHTPIVPSAAWKGRSGLGDYADFVMETDGSVAEILQTLDEAGVAGNTLVVFTADNGCSPQASTDDLERQGHFASAQFRGYKTDIWEGGHRVPFIVRWPGKVKAGGKTPALVGLNDLMATLAELTDIRLAESMAEDSVSFLDVLLGRKDAARQSLVHHSIQGKFAIRQGPWKLALTSGSGGWSKGVEEGSLQLYNLHEDEAETTNLAARHPAKVAELKDLLATIVDRGRSTPGPALLNDVPVQWRESD